MVFYLHINIVSFICITLKKNYSVVLYSEESLASHNMCVGIFVASRHAASERSPIILENMLLYPKYKKEEEEMYV